MLNWWTGGKPPVGNDLANSRAAVCQKCPMNQDSTRFEDITWIATTIAKTAFELKSHRFLKTENEHLLGVCNVCGCDLKLKVWSPLGHILTHTPQDQMRQFPEECWIATKDKPQPK